MGLILAGLPCSLRLAWPFALALTLAACTAGPKVVAGDENTVSIEAVPLADPAGFAEDYCQRFGKRAVAIGDIPLGPDTPTRLYDYNCVALEAPQN